MGLLLMFSPNEEDLVCRPSGEWHSSCSTTNKWSYLWYVACFHRDSAGRLIDLPTFGWFVCSRIVNVHIWLYHTWRERERESEKICSFSLLCSFLCSVPSLCSVALLCSVPFPLCALVFSTWSFLAVLFMFLLLVCLFFPWTVDPGSLLQLYRWGMWYYGSYIGIVIHLLPLKDSIGVMITCMCI